MKQSGRTHQGLLGESGSERVVQGGKGEGKTVNAK